MINLLHWLEEDVNYLAYDSHRHYMFSLKVFEEYKSFSPDVFTECIAHTTRYPPLVGMSTAPFYFIFGSSQDSATMINAGIFLAILLFSTYKIGEIFLDAKAGLLSAYIVSMYPVIFNQIKIYMLDLPLVAIVALSIFFLLKCDNFRSFRYSILFGVSMGLGLLVKLNYILFLIGPCIYFLLKIPSVSMKKGNLEKVYSLKRYLLNISLILISTVIISVPYFSNMHYQMKEFLSFILKNHIGLLNVLNYKGILQTWNITAQGGFFINKIRAVLWYIWGFINWQVTFLFFIAFIVALFFFLRARIKNKNILIVWIVSSVALVSCILYGIGYNMKISAVRFTMPMLPAVAIITALGIRGIVSVRARRSIIAVVVILSLVQAVFISYPVNANIGIKKIEIPVRIPDSISKYKLFPDSIVLFDPNSWFISGIGTGSHPVDRRMKIIACESIFQEIEQSTRNKETIVTIIPDDAHLWYLQYIAFTKNKSIRFFCDWSRLNIDLLHQKSSISDLVLKSDYIIEKIGGQQGEEYVLPLIQEARICFESKKDEFILLKKIHWPGNEIMLYKLDSGYDKTIIR